MEGSALRVEGYNHYDGSWANYSETVQQVLSGQVRYAPSARLSWQATVGRSDDQTDDYGAAGFVGGLTPAATRLRCRATSSWPRASG